MVNENIHKSCETLSYVSWYPLLEECCEVSIVVAEFLGPFKSQTEPKLCIGSGSSRLTRFKCGSFKGKYTKLCPAIPSEAIYTWTACICCLTFNPSLIDNLDWGLCWILCSQMKHMAPTSVSRLISKVPCLTSPAAAAILGLKPTTLIDKIWFDHWPYVLNGLLPWSRSPTVQILTQLSFLD